jgi:signal transduction histidine kinase
MLNVSSDLIALARSQVVLLTQTLGAVSSAMYVTEEISSDRQPNLIEVVAYPDAVTYNANPFSNPMLMLPAFREDSSNSMVHQGRIVIPLIYQDGIMGFLMTGREDRDWTDQEQIQIQQVANTLAIACALDRRSQWLGERMRAVQRDAYLQQQDFVASLLHQLRNPLTALRTFGQLLLRRILPEDKNYQLVAGIVRETRHIQDLLVEGNPLSAPQLISESEATLGTFPLLLPPALELEIVDLGEILSTLLISATAIAQEKNLKFSEHIPASLPFIQANTLAVREVLNNLIDNAIKYTPEYGSVDVNVSFNSESVQIKIADTGLGIPEADLSHLFERNFRGRQALGTIFGTGLGLAIARELVEKMGGKITVVSEVNLGSCFTVVFKPYQLKTSYIDPNKQLK